MFSWFVNLKGVSGNLRFTDLLDTIVSSPVDGQVPVFDSSNNKWYNKYVSIAKDDFIWISGTNDTDMVWTGGVKFQVNIPILAGSSYTPPVQDTQLTPKKYVDESPNKPLERINITNADSPYTLPALTDSKIITVDLTDGDVTINLPAVSSAQEGLFAHIYVERNPGNTGQLTVNTNGADLIRGQSSITFNVPWDGFRLYPHTYLINHWDALFWNRLEEIIMQPGNLGVDTVTTVQDLNNYMLSATLLTGGDITDNGDGTVDVSEAEVLIRNGVNGTDELKVYMIPAAANLAMTSDAVTNVVVEYNSGNPRFNTSPYGTIINGNDKIPLYIVSRNGSNNLDIAHFDNIGRNFSKNYGTVEARTNWLQHVSGLIPTINPTFNDRFNMTSGTLRTAINTYDITSFDGSTDTFTLVYRNGLGGWTHVTGVSDIPAQYDDGDGTPATLTQYGVFWIAVSASGDRYYVLMGKTQYANIAQARAVTSPSTPIPNFMNDFGTASIEARVIYEGGQIREIAVFRSAKATITATSNHNELGGLQGGTTDEYYHLTQAEYSTLQSGVSGSFTTADGKTVTVTSGIITSIV